MMALDLFAYAKHAKKYFCLKGLATSEDYFAQQSAANPTTTDTIEYLTIVIKTK
jgi:hypothetical protein